VKVDSCSTHTRPESTLFASVSNYAPSLSHLSPSRSSITYPLSAIILASTSLAKTHPYVTSCFLDFGTCGNSRSRRDCVLSEHADDALCSASLVLVEFFCLGAVCLHRPSSCLPSHRGQ
jgi:hypothetical protein